jgi:hypothetical protein
VQPGGEIAARLHARQLLSAQRRCDGRVRGCTFGKVTIDPVRSQMNAQIIAQPRAHADDATGTVIDQKHLNLPPDERST